MKNLELSHDLITDGRFYIKQYHLIIKLIIIIIIAMIINNFAAGVIPFQYTYIYCLVNH